MSPIFQIYQDRGGEWRWRLKAANRRIVADSGEGYRTRAGVLRAASRLVSIALDAPGAEIIDAPEGR